MAGPSLFLVSLGCPKNRVDSELMLGLARASGVELCDDPARADIIVVNTCGFIEPARRESIEVILEMAEHRRGGSCRCLVVSGCLPQGHAEELAAGLPEVDHFIGAGDVPKLQQVLAGTAARVGVGRPEPWLPSATAPRVLTALTTSTAGTGAGVAAASAYVKIAEGCDRSCAFCVIPKLRGAHRSRPVEDLVREVAGLVARGVKEINLVSQDTVAYGRDRTDGRHSRPGAALATLAERLAEVDGVAWLRLLYLYPDDIDDRLIDLLQAHPKVVPYVDMPLQHGSNAMLRRMKRGHGARRVRQLVERLRSAVEELTFRSAFIVGHPGETQADFDELCAFVQWAGFERLGVFRYSDEPETRSHRMDGKVPPLVACNRERRLVAIGRRLARAHQQRLLGRVAPVLVEGPSDEHELVLMGRHPGQAPEIDGQVYLSAGDGDLPPPVPGEILLARFVDARDYDLVAEPVDPTAEDGSAPARAPAARGSDAG